MVITWCVVVVYTGKQCGHESRAKCIHYDEADHNHRMGWMKFHLLCASSPTLHPQNKWNLLWHHRRTKVYRLYNLQTLPADDRIKVDTRYTYHHRHDPDYQLTDKIVQCSYWTENVTDRLWSHTKNNNVPNSSTI